MVILSGFWRAVLDPFEGSKQHFGRRLGVSLAILGPVKASGATALLLAAKLGDLEGKVKLSGGHIEAKLGYVMLCHVEAICQILFGHVVGFASRNALPQLGFCELCCQYGYLMATLVPSWGQPRRFWGCEGYMGSFWTMLLRHSQKQPIHLRNAQIKLSQNTKNCQNASLHGSKGKT